MDVGARYPLFPIAVRTLEVYRGRTTFYSTANRMEVVRIATLRGELNGLPLTTRVLVDSEIGTTAPEHGHFAEPWPARVTGRRPLATVGGMRLGERRINRCPHDGVYTADYMRVHDSESSGEDSSGQSRRRRKKFTS